MSRQQPIQVEFTMAELSAVIEVIEHHVASQRQQRSPVAMEVEWAFNRMFHARELHVERNNISVHTGKPARRR